MKMKFKMALFYKNTFLSIFFEPSFVTQGLLSSHFYLSVRNCFLPGGYL